MRSIGRLAASITFTLATLWVSSGPVVAQDLHLTPFSNFTFNNPIGIDFHEPAGKLIMSVNYPTGLGNPPSAGNLDLVAPGNAVPTQFSNLAGLTNELKLASVRVTGCDGGFEPGTVFTGNGNPGEVVRISADGTVVDNPWVTLKDTVLNFTEPALVRGSLFQDRVCAAGGDLIVVTGNEQGQGPADVGNVWRVTSTGITTLVAQLGRHLEGVATVPNDPDTYGPLAGKIIAGDEDFINGTQNGPNGKIFAVDPNTGAFFTIGGGNGLGPACTPGTALPSGCHYKTAQPFNPEDLDLIRKNAQFFGVAFRDGVILTAPASDFAARCGQILITQEFPFGGTSGLYALRWDPATNSFVADLLTATFNVQQWEHVTFTTGEDCFVPRIVVEKTPDNATFNVGDTLTFTIVIRNDGDADALDVVLNDPLPTTGGLTWVVDTVTPAKPCTINAGQVLNCTIGTLAPAEQVSVVVKSSNVGGAPTAACTGAKLNNVATVTSSNAGEVEDTGDYTCQRPSITITKNPKNATFQVGQQLSFTIVVTSTGPGTAQSVTLNDPLPTTGGLTWGVTSVLPSGTCSINGAQQLSCTFGDLANGQQRTVVVTTNSAGGAPLAACTGAKLNNVATASATSLTPVQDTGDYTCLPPGIDLVKRPNTGTFDIGEQLRFVLVVTSTGPGTAKDVTLRDFLPTPGGLTWEVVNVGPSGSCNINPVTQVLNCSFGDLPANATRRVVVRTNNAGGAPPAACTGETINNTGTVRATGLDPVRDRGAFICLPPSLSITKSPKNATFNIGNQLSFNIVVTSTGPGTAKNVTLNDPLPTTGGLTWGLTSVLPSGTCSINGAQVLSCTFGDLPVSAARTVVVTTDNLGGAPPASCTGSKLNNVATAAATGMTPVQDTGDYTCQPPSLSITKSPKNATFNIGDPLSFTIVVTSTGPGAAQNVTLSDPLPTTGGLTWGVTSVLPSGNCAIDGTQTLSCTFGTLANGQQRTVVVTSSNAAGAPAAACTGNKLNNVATAAATGVPNVQDTGDYTCLLPGISITKNPKNATFVVGDQLSFTIVVSSNGPGTAVNVTMTDPLPTLGGLTWGVTSVLPSGTCSINAAQQLSCAFGNLAAGQQRTVVVTTNNVSGAPTASCINEKLNNTATAVATGLAPVQDTGDYICNPSLICPVTDQPTDGTITVTTLPNGNFLVVYNQGRTLNDNSYGVNAVWGGDSHSFNNLVGSDHAEFIFKDTTGQVVLQFALDYIHAKPGTPSGFGSLGFGGDGDPVSEGNAAHVLGFETSLDVNLNGRPAGSAFGPAFQAFCNAGNCTVNGVNLLVNSPPTVSNTSYQLLDPATFGRWIFDNYYAVVIDKAAFGAAGFGSVQIAEVHNSPSKGNPGDTVECPSPSGGGDACVSGKKVQKVEMQYTGLTCANTSHTQDAGKVICTDAAALISPVRILATSKDGNRVWFDGTVSLNGTFIIDAGAAGKETLDSDTLVKIFNLQGTLLQTVQFHTSCSQPLDENDRFGSLNVVDLTLVNK